jgi:hypothetical protein
MIRVVAAVYKFGNCCSGGCSLSSKVSSCKLLGWGSDSLEVLENFLFVSMSGMVLGCTYPPVRWVPDGGDLSSEVNASRT